LNVIADRESDLSVAKHKVREVISWKQNQIVPGFIKFSEKEQMRSETTLKTWEHHIEESKMLEKEVKANFLTALLSIEDKMEDTILL